jgi:KilA-N domain
MVVHHMSNPKSFVQDCKRLGVTYELLIESQESLGKQSTARMFNGKSKRGGGGFCSAASIENWLETFKYVTEHPDQDDHDQYQAREVLPNEEWYKFVEIIKTPIDQTIIESWKKFPKKKLGEEAKKYGYTVGIANSKAIMNIHERLLEMVQRRKQNIWDKQVYEKVEDNELNLNYQLMNIFKLREIAKEHGISTNLNKEDMINEIKAFQENDSISIEYAEMSTSRLKLLAKDRGLLEYNNLKKDELVESLKRLDSEEQNERDKKDYITLGGIEIISRPEDGYINATQLCKAGRKEYSSWFRNTKTFDFLNELETVLQICRTEILKINNGGIDQHTWVHPRVAIHIAQWVSPKFAVLVTGWIQTLLSTGSVSIERPVKAFSTLTEMDVEAEELEQQIKLEEYTTHSVIYVSYIGKGLLKVGFSDGRLLQRNKKHTSTESMYSQWRFVQLTKVSGKPIEKMLHDFLVPYQTEFNKQKEIYKPTKTISAFLDMITTFLSDNDLPMKIRKLEKRIYELELQNISLKLQLK